MSANSANSGSTGTSGGTGNGSGLFPGWFIPDRLDLPFVSAPNVGGQVLISISQFPVKRWSPPWSAYLLLQAFVDAAPPWTAGVGCPAPAAPNTLGGEIAQLIRAAEDERADALGEILAQSAEFVSDFIALLNITPGSNPVTCQLLFAAEMIGALVVMYFKDQFKRPRPSHLCPGLLPPIPVPGHPSYPSGHSTQAHLMALMIADLLPPTLKAPGHDLSAVAFALAHRIARNREIAGLHYHSDSIAGAILARNILDFFRTNSPAVGVGPNDIPKTYGDAQTAAQAEWS